MELDLVDGGCDGDWGIAVRVRVCHWRVWGTLLKWRESEELGLKVEEWVGGVVVGSDPPAIFFF